MLALIFGLVGALAAAPRVAADKVYGSSSTQAYANGNYGNIPSQSFYTRPDLTAPAVNIATSKAGQADGYLFTNWEGSQCPRSMPYIIDTNGHMVWMPEDAFLTHVSPSQRDLQTPSRNGELMQALTSELWRPL